MTGFKKFLLQTSAKEALEKLQTLYKGEEKVKKAQLQTPKGEFESLFIKKAKSISDYFVNFLVLSNQLKRNGEKLEDVRIMEKICHLLDPKFEHIVITIEETKDLEAVTIKQL